jgi:hypothetical protein
MVLPSNHLVIDCLGGSVAVSCSPTLHWQPPKGDIRLSPKARKITARPTTNTTSDRITSHI